MTRTSHADTASTPPHDQIWPKSTTLFLLLVGFALATFSFVVVLNMPELPWPPNEDAQLRDAYGVFRDTGVLLSTSGATAAGSAGDSLSPLSMTAGPGATLFASLFGALFGFPSPYVVLSAMQATVIAVPLLWLPLCVARIFKRARAGYALVLLPPAIWLLNSGTILVGTEYGLAEVAGSLRVPALYGIPASLTFLALSLLILLRSLRLPLMRLAIASAGMGALAGIIMLFDWYSAAAVVIAVPIAWWSRAPRSHRLLHALAAGLISLALAVAMFAAFVGGVNLTRSSPATSDAPAMIQPNGFWHDAYAGLAYPESVGGSASPLDVPASDDQIVEQVLQSAPGVEVGTSEYDNAVRDLYLETVSANPMETVGLYLQKCFHVIKYFGAMISFILVGFVLALTRRAPQRRSIAAAFAIVFPSLTLGFVVAVVSTPGVYSYGLLSAALGLLAAIALGAIVWSITSLPSHVRSVERTRLSGRRRTDSVPIAPASDPASLSVIVPTRNGEDVLEDTVNDLGARLTARDEIIIVENGSTDGTTALVEDLQRSWSFASRLVLTHSDPGLGEALRTGVLESTGTRLLLTADDLPFGFTDLDEFSKLPQSTAVAIGSKAHPRSQVSRSRLRTVQSRIFRFLREALLQSRVGDSQGTLWVDGPWGREFALLSRETGLMWTTELVLAAEQQGIEVQEVPVALSNRHEAGASRFRASDAWQSVVGFTRLAVYKDDYCDEDWAPSTRPSREPEEITA